MLSVDVDQKFREFLHLSGSDGLPIDPVDTFSHLHLPAYNDSAIFLRFNLQLQKFLPDPPFHTIEHQLHKGTLLSLPEHVLLKFPPQGQIDAPKEQGLSRAGLPGEDVQPPAEFHLRLLHQRQVFNM